MSFPACIVPARAKHTATVIFAHGLGDSGEGWRFLGEKMGSSKVFSNIKWIFPNAPMRPVTLNYGMRMSSWYDIATLDGVEDEEDEENMMRSSKEIHKIVMEERNEGINSERIIVGGFSQGCVIGLLSGLTYKERLGGIIGFSGYLPLRKKIHTMISESNLRTPIFMGHGRNDPIVKFEYGQESARILKEDLKLNVKWKEYDGLQHSVNENELKDFSVWLGSILGEGGSEK
ncbi:hypothetical protein T552_00392 [Pneumocystis carinii B80]|uniref:Acyl-protein thioesterase 1 n=1 Tax=Pneumocystis carinii (strain B80) TaxID=1408658 RepID=A0A0W4ZQM5_PNEC8|nr:hypothetical protein T552_00392 [Pneumocystis carinii B80]KTW30679.1 hypothetical protein T552_00392 [Pneumocystis carinii B80]